MIHTLECVGIEIVVVLVGAGAIAVIVYGLIKGRKAVSEAYWSKAPVRKALDLVGNIIACILLVIGGLGVLLILLTVLTALYHGICLFMGH
jgi:hypothetical protein